MLSSLIPPLESTTARDMAARQAIVRLTCSMVLSMVLSTPDEALQAQPPQAPAQSVRLVLTAEVHDSTIDYRYSIQTQHVRLSNGHVAIGPLKGRDTISMLRQSSDFGQTLGYARTGFGPRELSGTFVLAAAPNGATLTASRSMARAKLFATDGSLLRIAPIPEVVDGIGLCGNEIVLSGVQFINGGWLAGVFRTRDNEASVRLVHSLQSGSKLRPSDGYNQMLSVRSNRLLAAIPNRASVAISDSGCRTIRRLSVALPWYKSWDVAPEGMPWNGPAPPKIYSVQWHSDTSAWLLTYRPNPKAQYFNDAKSRTSPVPPKALEIPLTETVLTLFDTRSGAVLAETTLPRVGWKFLSSTELIRRRLGSESEHMEVYRMELFRPRARSGP